MEELNLVVSVGEVVRTFAYTIENSHTVGITFVLDLVSDIKDTMFDKNGTESLVWISPEEIGNYKNEGDHDYITLKKYFSLQE